jgi:hypothetical protein
LIRLVLWKSVEKNQTLILLMVAATGGATTLLPSLRFAQPYNKLADGKQVYLTTERQLVCEHGELSSTISFWLSMKKKARADGTEPPRRGGFNPSICDCATTEGLNGTIPESVCTPCKPVSLFEFLEASEAESIKVKGRDTRQIPHLHDATFVSTIGSICCRHGYSRRSLIKKQRTTARSSRLPSCDCRLPPLSLHTGLRGLQLGKFSKLAVPEV